MPITFKKDALITAAREAIAVHERAVTEWEAAKAQYREDNAPTDDVRERVVALRDELSRFLKTKRQPERADAVAFRKAAGADGLSGMYVTPVQERDVDNNVPKPSGFLYRNRADSYRGLIKMLEANLEDTITAAQLKLFGYNDLETLFRRAAESGGTASVS